jgi:hypothetical protein
MSDNILTAVLTFSLLAGGTAAIGSEMFETRQPAMTPTPIVVMPQVTITAQRAAPAEVVTLPMVMVTAQRAANAAEVVTLPMVLVTGRREATTVAVETRASETPRVE